MTYRLTPLHRLPADCPAAQPCALTSAIYLPAEPFDGALWNDTPDAIRDCAASWPQAQQPRALSATTACIEADHGATTRAATH